LHYSHPASTDRFVIQVPYHALRRVPPQVRHSADWRNVELVVVVDDFSGQGLALGFRNEHLNVSRAIVLLNLATFKEVDDRYTK